MAYNLLDYENIVVNFDDIMASKINPVCSFCKQNLMPVVNKNHLLKCDNCNRYTLSKPDDYDTSINITIGMRTNLIIIQTY
jgi:hypothetical protein